LTRLHNLTESKLNKIVRAILNCDLTSKQREEVKLIVNKKSTSRGKRGMGPKAWDMEDAK
jgi:hypothetical protein